MVVDEQGVRVSILEGMVRQFIGADLLLVEADRKTAGMFDLPSTIDFVATQACKGRILLTNREFSGFVVVESNGVASGWSKQKPEAP